MEPGEPANRPLPTVVTVPCFSGAPWDTDELEPLADLPFKTMRLPEALDTIEAYADFVSGQIRSLSCYVLVGDSFGAVVSLALAIRQPVGLRALVLSGGFARNPVRNPLLRARIRAARFLPGPLYTAITLRMHAASLSSPYDAHGQVAWSRAKTRRLFRTNTPHRSYVARARAALDADYLDSLNRVVVPTLLLTPSHDTLIGQEAASEMLEGIPDSQEVILPKTGHMFRFSHPKDYAQAIRTFLVEKFGMSLDMACA